MQLQVALASIFLIACQTAQVNANKLESAIELLGNLQRRSVALDAALNENAVNFLSHRDSNEAHVKRQPASGTDGSAPNPSVSPLSGDSGAQQANNTAWEAKTSKACESAVGQLIGNGGASNPSGMAVCYNLPFLDNSTGVFEAELRMYNVSVPSGQWVGLTAQDMSLSMSYFGATTQLTSVQKRELGEEDLVNRQTQAMPQIKLLQFVGQINSNLMGPAESVQALQPLLVPIITISAKSKSGDNLNTTLSSTEASFVSGVFEDSTTNITSAAALASASALVITATPFVVPGRTFGIFPTGLIIVCIWTLLFSLAVGWGTFERIKFREQYRRRVQMENGRSVRTI